MHYMKKQESAINFIKEIINYSNFECIFLRDVYNRYSLD